MNLIDNFVAQALSEDMGRGDLYALIANDTCAYAHIIAKDIGVFSGACYVESVVRLNSLSLDFCLADGVAFEKGDILCKLSGSHITLLQIERVLLNILAHSSGIATLCAQYVQEVKDFSVKILDTRKTRPLLRNLEKYSIRNGGAHNHRFGLDTMLMLKDTHLAYIGDLQRVISTARSKLPFMCPIEVECESFERAIEAIKAGADVIMCDNMNPQEISQVVAYRDSIAAHICIEASGNITLENIRAYAQSGVDAISIGSLIHQARWLDISMKIVDSF